MISNKGFLFTLASIFFASTIVFFAQGFYEANLISEREIISSSMPLNIVLLNEDIAQSVSDLFGLEFDINSNEKSMVISGRMNSDSSESNSLSSYSSFVSSNYFPRLAFNESLDLSNLTDGKAEFFIGDELNFDYNYGNSVALFSNSSLPLDSIDLNIKTTGTLSSYEWVPLSGDNFSVSINYSDDSNAIILNGSIGKTSASYLKLIYPDGNTFVRLGNINYLGVDYNSAFIIESKQNQVINYMVKADYADANFYPVKINSILSVKSANIDSNTLLTLFK
ncbi:MAG: hypothetical protein PHD05_02210 [Sphaerochaetaceae bacterium]|nr:hypothetical protein [Sphaerochaetaceae bacterium]